MKMARLAQKILRMVVPVTLIIRTDYIPDFKNTLLESCHILNLYHNTGSLIVIEY